MKTPVRIQYTNSQGMYKIMHIEILNPRYGGTDHLEPIGEITFQQTVGEDKWYGMTFSISTDNIQKLKKFTKTIEFVAKNTSYDSQPEEVLKLIGADEHRIVDHEFVSMSKIGQRKYKVMVNGNQHYKNIIAKNDEDANKQLKRLDIANSEIIFTGVVVL
jgi:hypothetical protein